MMVLPAAFCFGVAVTNDRFLLGSLKVYPYTALSFVLPALFLLLVRPGSLARMRPLLGKAVLPKMLLLCGVYAVQTVTFFIALQLAPTSSQVASINITGVVITVLLAVVFLRERDHLWRTLVGSVCSFAGLLLLI